LGGVFSAGVSVQEAVENFMSDMNPEDWLHVHCPFYVETLTIVEPEIVEPIAIVLRMHCNVVCDADIDEEVSTAYAVAEFFRNAERRDNDIDGMMADLIVRLQAFFEKAYSIGFHVPTHQRWSDVCEEMICDMIHRLADINMFTVNRHFFVHHLRLLNFIACREFSLLWNFNGLQIFQRVLGYCLNTSPFQYNKKVPDATEVLYLCDASIDPHGGFKFENTDHISCIQRQSLVMKAVVADRWRNRLVLSRALIEKIVIEGFPEEIVNDLARLSLFCRVFLAPQGQFSPDYQWGQYAYAQLQNVVPWLQIAHYNVNPTKCLNSYGDISMELYNKLRSSPRNVSGCIMELNGFTHCEMMNQKEDSAPDVIMEDTPDEPEETVKQEVKTIELSSYVWTGSPVSALTIYSQRNKILLKEVDFYNVGSSDSPLWRCVMSLSSSSVEVEKQGCGHTKKTAKQNACVAILDILPIEWNN